MANPLWEVHAGEPATLATEPLSPGSGTARTRVVRTTRSGATEPVRILDRYILKRRLGSGAFGTVWSARDERLERDVAVKVLPRERVIPARFEREARAAARLIHPAIVTLYEAAVDDEGAYLVSELVRGATLADLLQDGRMSDRDIVEVGLALCDALEHAHAEGVIHRDVKPSNILVCARRGGPPAKLTDFGVARVVGGDSLTRTGDIVGTAAYMAPEQAEGREAGPPADLYSLALVLYEALTGVNPLAQVIRYGRPRRLGTYLPPIRRQRRDLPRNLSAAIDGALRPRPSERGTVDRLRHALGQALEDVDTEVGVVAAPRPLTLMRSRTPEEEGEFGPAWRERGRAPVQPAAAGEDASGRRARSGILHRLGPRAALILTAILTLALGTVGLAAALPAAVGVAARRAHNRAILAALAFGWLGAATLIAGRNLFWSPDNTPLPAALSAAAVWAAAAVVLPWLRRLPNLPVQVAALLAWGVALSLGLRAAGLLHTVNPVLGTVAGVGLAGGVLLLDLVREARLS